MGLPPVGSTGRIGMNYRPPEKVTDRYAYGCLNSWVCGANADGTGFAFIDVTTRDFLNHPCHLRLKELPMSPLLVWLMVGCATGLLVSVVARAGVQSTVLNLVSGMSGAWIAGWAVLPALGVPTLPQSSIGWASIAVAFIGALMLLTLVHLLRPDSPR
ncbi:MAG: GlsB/YeaQ/YmgE family stress response membrane protein [Rubrivivax sp.]|nr:MAG: GlsB/YeaQ/YmgE family stress response membrane protein [Rubrivivax sp.]